MSCCCSGLVNCARWSWSYAEVSLDRCDCRVGWRWRPCEMSAYAWCYRSSGLVTSVYLWDKGLVIYIGSVCGIVIMISVHHTTVIWLLLVGVSILVVTVSASWRNTVEVDPDGSSLLVLYWLCRLYCCSTLIEVCGCRVLTVTQQNKLKIIKYKYVDTMCVLARVRCHACCGFALVCDPCSESCLLLQLYGWSKLT